MREGAVRIEAGEAIMKKRMILFIVLLFAFYGMCFADAPHQIGGFVLGKHIKDYKDLVNMESAMIRRHGILLPPRLKRQRFFTCSTGWS